MATHDTEERLPQSYAKVIFTLWRWRVSRSWHGNGKNFERYTQDFSVIEVDTSKIDAEGGNDIPQPRLWLSVSRCPGRTFLVHISHPLPYPTGLGLPRAPD